MNIHDLVFEKKNRLHSTQAKVSFINGYGASVITGPTAYTDHERPYEVAVLHKENLCYTTPITDDVLGYKTAKEVEDILEKIKALPAKNE